MGRASRELGCKWPAAGMTWPSGGQAVVGEVVLEVGEPLTERDAVGRIDAQAEDARGLVEIAVRGEGRRPCAHLRACAPDEVVAGHATAGGLLAVADVELQLRLGVFSSQRFALVCSLIMARSVRSWAASSLRKLEPPPICLSERSRARSSQSVFSTCRSMVWAPFCPSSPARSLLYFGFCAPLRLLRGQALGSPSPLMSSPRSSRLVDSPPAMATCGQKPGMRMPPSSSVIPPAFCAAR